ncbi:hypothetical protein CVIRNUC_001085 [Coccomyxa viridis]|uniref:Uncharacterized protein n=1 Tax=Coccomyxa viridis TaxID=1274662 RepID=A0AAV1HS86_9CHLO|nr:hypothetical protein CVIRNUC_001085 [Coccomyxa viridis]
MSQYRTDQERIDAATLEIKNPNVVGSGYIQHPPQKPFAAPLQMQPPTVAHFEFPDEYSKYRAQTRQSGRGQAPARGGQDQRSQGHAQTNGRLQNGAVPYNHASGQQGVHRQTGGGQPRPQHQASAGAAPARAPLARPGRAPRAAAAPSAQVRPAAIPVGPPQALSQAAPQQHAHNGSQRGHMRAPPPQHMQGRQQAHAVPVMQAASHAERQGTAALSHKMATMSVAGTTSALAAQHPAQLQAARPSEAEQDADKGMSKSQAKRIRKKKREGKV